MSQSDDNNGQDTSTRREVMNLGAAGSAFAALAAAGYVADDGSRPQPFIGASLAAGMGEAPQAPFDGMRDWIAALEAHGLLMRFEHR